MDPNANLKEQIEISRRIIAAADGKGMYPDGTDLVRLAQLVLALDEWIRKGGFLPDRWAGLWKPK